MSDTAGATRRETVEMEAPAYLVDMSGSGMPDILFPEDEYDGAHQYATGMKIDEADGEHEEESRISIVDFDGTREVPIADV